MDFLLRVLNLLNTLWSNFNALESSWSQICSLYSSGDDTKTIIIWLGAEVIIILSVVRIIKTVLGMSLPNYKHILINFTIFVNLLIALYS